MTIRDGSFFRTSFRVLLAVSVVCGFPTASTGDLPGEQTFADRLRKGPGFANHPVGVVPSGDVQIPDGWPLDLDGSITCLTCHESLPPLDGVEGALLRGKGELHANSGVFCAICHNQLGQQRGPNMHWMALQRAHIKSGWNNRQNQIGLLDVASRECLSCHDGVTAPESLNSTPNSRRVGYSGDMRRSHPVGVDYRDRSSNGRSLPLRPVGSLPASIQLPDNKVSCVSCHNLYAKEEHLLTVPIEGSALCFTCHDIG